MLFAIFTADSAFPLHGCDKVRTWPRQIHSRAQTVRTHDSRTGGHCHWCKCRVFHGARSFFSKLWWQCFLQGFWVTQVHKSRCSDLPSRGIAYWDADGNNLSCKILLVPLQKRKEPSPSVNSSEAIGWTSSTMSFPCYFSYVKSCEKRCAYSHRTHPQRKCTHYCW